MQSIYILINMTKHLIWVNNPIYSWVTFRWKCLLTNFTILNKLLGEYCIIAGHATFLGIWYPWYPQAIFKKQTLIDKEFAKSFIFQFLLIISCILRSYIIYHFGHLLISTCKKIIYLYKIFELNIYTQILRLNWMTSNVEIKLHWF